MKRWILLLLVLLTPGIAFAQNTSVSGTITDAGGQAWFNGTYTFTFRVSNDNPNANYKQNGAPFDLFFSADIASAQVGGKGSGY